MTKRRVEHAPFAIISGPSNGEVTVRAMDARIVQIDFGLIQPRENAHALARELFYFIDFVVRDEPVRKCLSSPQMSNLLQLWEHRMSSTDDRRNSRRSFRRTLANYGTHG